MTTRCRLPTNQARRCPSSPLSSKLMSLCTSIHPKIRSKKTSWNAATQKYEFVHSREWLTLVSISYAMQKGTVCIWPVASLCPPCSLPSHTACTCAMDKKMYLSLLERFLQMLYYFLGLAPWQCMWGGKTVHTMQHHIQRPATWQNLELS